MKNLFLNTIGVFAYETFNRQLTTELKCSGKI